MVRSKALLPVLTILTIGLALQGQAPSPPLKNETGPAILERALREQSLSHNRKLSKEVKEEHSLVYNIEIKLAYEQLLRESKAGELESMFRLGAYGRTFAKEGLATVRECLPWLEQAANKGHQEAPFNYALGLIEMDSQLEKAKGFEWLQRSTQIGNCRYQAAVELARYYTYGFPEIQLSRDSRQAWKWVRMGATFQNCSVGEFLSENGLQNPDKVSPKEILYPRPSRTP